MDDIFPNRSDPKKEKNRFGALTRISWRPNLVFFFNYRKIFNEAKTCKKVYLSLASKKSHQLLFTGS